MQNSYPEQIRKKLQEIAGDKIEQSEVAWAMAEANAAVIDGLLDLDVVGNFGSAIKGIYTLITNNPTELPPNPWFVWNGHDHKTSPVTFKYLEKRGYIDGFSSISAAISGGLSLLTVVNIGALAQHGYSSASTVKHLKEFRTISDSYKHSETISAWLQLIILLKGLKLDVRGGQLAITAVSALPGAAAPAQALATIITAGTKLGINLKFSTMSKMLAMELHWRAYQEHVLLEGSTDGTGPAIRILEELFTRRGILVTLLGKHDVDTIIHEPAGWLAISDKLLLI